jgi:hypothetical protein
VKADVFEHGGAEIALIQQGCLKVYAETADNNMLSTSATDFGT